MPSEKDILAAAREADSLVTSHEQPNGQGGQHTHPNGSAPAVKRDDSDSDEEHEDDHVDAASTKMEEEPDVDEERRRDQRIAKLKFLLEKSSIYSRIMGERMEAERVRRAENAAKRAAAQAQASSKAAAAPNGTSGAATAAGRRATRSRPGEEGTAESSTSASQPTSRARKKRKTEDKDGDYEISEYLDEGDLQAAQAAAQTSSDQKNEQSLNGRKRSRKDQDVADGTENDEKDTKDKVHHERAQPRLLTGAKMRDYQLDGLEWLISLYENGLNGILADEMGLGKTIQTISFFAHLRENGVWGPFLVCAPLSTITNWVLEFERFTPDIPVILYYGTAPERTRLRDEHRLTQIPRSQKDKDRFPIVVSSYEVIMRDRKYLAGLDWKYIVVDEGHRLKNMDCKLIRELKTYRSANRLILTGTPLHNNLAELWSLLNFILPDIFDDLATFEKWFDFSDLHEDGGDTASGGSKLLSKEQSGSIITQLHAILKPFLLRRLKADVETDLPPKKEYLLYAPLTEEQKDLYEAILGKDVRRWLMERKTGLQWTEIAEVLEGEWEEKRAAEEGKKTAGKQQGRSPVKRANQPRHSKHQESENDSEHEDEHRSSRYPRRRARNEVNYRQLDADFDEATWHRIDAAEGGEALGEQNLNQLDSSMSAWRSFSARASSGRSSMGQNGKGSNGPSQALQRQVGKKRAAELATELQGKKWLIREAQKEINNLHLENIVMQLRKICCHPFLFDWPIDREAGLKVVNENLINASGKMLMLNRLLDALFARGHKVLIFSQFTTMLDIIEDWATEYKGLRICRIDGSTSQDLRRSQMKSFNEETGPNACNLFLLSTRAGGLGINLVAADTVIFYDSDWNPQMDLQAQDRVHRIGQKKPVLIFRLVSANTVEQKILKRASNKRKLEALVIQQGKFRLPAGMAKSVLGSANAGAGSKEKEGSLAEMAAALLKLDGEQVQLVRKGDEIISDANLERLLDRSPAAYQRQRGWVGAVDGGEHDGDATAENEDGDSKRKGRSSKPGSSSSTSTPARGRTGGRRAAFEVTSTEVENDVNDVVARLMAGEHDTNGAD